MTPLQITATLDGPIMGAAIRLDALLMAAVAKRDNLPPADAYGAGEVPVLQIPVALSPCGRIYLASSSEYTEEPGGHETTYTNRRFPAEHAAVLAPRMRRVTVSTGLYKSYRIPRQTAHLQGDRLTWWAIGDREQMLALWNLIPSLGRKHGAGFGHVARWTAEPCDVWPGFPVLREGKPLRPLPLDWPGLMAWEEDLQNLMPPTWDKTKRVLCAV